VVVVWSDEQLLRQFLSRTDESAEAAFTTLIERYGPIVHRVCLNVLRDREEAQDAAQAVFLVLARKAASIRKPGSLGPWLHGVAFRLARRARSEEGRRRAAERRKAEIMHQQPTPDDGLDPLGYTELHEEVDRLPEKYRKPIILCYMQGRTQAQAADELGWPLGTLQVRLHRGRHRLRSRLARRVAGPIILAGTGLAASLSAKAGTPGQAWTDATAAAAVQFASGKEIAGLVAPAVTRMAESALAAMLRDTLDVVALLAMTVLLSAGALSLMGPLRRMATVAGLHAKPESMPKLSPLEVPAVTVVAMDPAARSLAPGWEELEERPTLRAPLPDPLSKDLLKKSHVSPGQLQDTVPVDRRIEGKPIQGRELFERVWVKDDPRGYGGDGLGPVFNGTSCVACHHQGGPGGAGGADRNIEIATLTDSFTEATGYYYAFSMDFGAGRFDYRMGNPPGPSSRSSRRVDPRAGATIHPGFREAQSVVLHHYGTNPAYNAWRGSVPGQHGTIRVRTSERNPPPLFGAGLIDAIPDEAIEAAAKRRLPNSSTVRGRVSRLNDGRIGRYGWKAQTATLKEFVLSAAAGEMGLEVPGRHQAADPCLPGIGATGLDMDEAECDALTNYVRNLPAPSAIEPANDLESAQIKSGEEAFRAIGCTHCHMPKLGGIDGIYSDLLLHDMGPQLTDLAEYSGFTGDPPKGDGVEPPDRALSGNASIQEWRTPPLWGLRDSAPYLHDGRAASIDRVVALHGGQGASSAKRYAELSLKRKRHLTAFLRSLAAPAAN
jgi:RNA polymerase sigma factor (sigma-70 family)